MICIENKTKQQSKKRWLSPSSINKYLHCPRKFYYSQIEKRHGSLNVHLIRGIAVHSAIHQFYKQKLYKAKNILFDDLKQITIDLFKDEWERKRKALRALKLNDVEIEFFYQDSRKMMINFIYDVVKEKGFNKDPPLMEKMLFSQELKTLGRTDAIFSGRDPPLIIDYKTSKSKELTKEYKLQMAIYALLYQENYQQIPNVALHFLRFPSGFLTYQITPKLLAETRTLINDIHQKTASDNIEDYPCVCGWCETDFKKGGQV